MMRLLCFSIEWETELYPIYQAPWSFVRLLNRFNGGVGVSKINSRLVFTPLKKAYESMDLRAGRKRLPAASPCVHLFNTCEQLNLWYWSSKKYCNVAYPLNSTIHGIEILYQTAPNHGNLSKRWWHHSFKTMLVSLCTKIDCQMQSIIFSWLYLNNKLVVKLD